MYTLVLNETNLVPSFYNNQFMYKFPVGSVLFKDKQIAINSIRIYYSWFNINFQVYSNATCSYTWFDGKTYYFTTGSTVGNIPNMFADIAVLNTYLQYVFIQNKHYLINSAGQNVYFIELKANAQYYNVQLNIFALDAAIASTNTWSLPAGATWVIPAAPQTPYFNVLSTSNFNALIGFNYGVYPPTLQTSNYSINSQITPQIAPVTSLITLCSLINSPYSTPSQIIYSFSPDVPFGTQIISDPPNFSFQDIQQGYVTQFSITFVDQDGRNIQLIDTNLLIVLLIKDKQEYLL